MKTCKMCHETMPIDEFIQGTNICECCHADDFESMDLEDKMEVLLK